MSKLNVRMPNSSILIVDDEINNLNSLSKILKLKGYEVRAVASGKLALEAIKSKKPNLILMDIKMPEMTGFEVCEILKNDIEYKDIPIIFISGLYETFDKVKAFSLGAVDYVTKPFELEELYMRVETHIKLYSLMNDLQDIVDMQMEEISQSQVSTIIALAKLTQTRDDDTGKHTERIKAYCSIIATELSKFTKYRSLLSSTQIEAISQASILHDIGKVGIKDRILLKPGKLTDDEYGVMKTHTTIGADTLEVVRNLDQGNSFLKIGIDVAKYHHERWDGAGYPLGLKEKEIPLAARIMAIADVYDALKSKRCYKPEFTHEEACEIIKSGSGTQFDPDVVAAFLEVHEEMHEVWKNNVKR